MGFAWKQLLGDPWRKVKLFVPLTVLVPLVAYWITLSPDVFPGVSARMTAEAAGLIQTNDLTYPIFKVITHMVAALPWGELPVRLNFFCVLCGALATAAFYLLTARLILIFACEDPGGAMSILFARRREDNDDDEEADVLPIGAKVPESIQRHNRRVSTAAVIGGLSASVMFAFCAPFWLVSTRLYPFAFDLLFFFTLCNLVIAHDQAGRMTALLGSMFLVTLFCIESPLFLLAAPLAIILLMRTSLLNEQESTRKISCALAAGALGLVAAGSLLLTAAKYSTVTSAQSPQLILSALFSTMFDELLRWVPSSHWELIVAQVIIPAVIAAAVFGFAFCRRSAALFAVQLVVVACIIPSLLNLTLSPWGIARQQTTSVPVYAYTFIALILGMMIAAWFLMTFCIREIRTSDLDFYEQRDNLGVCYCGTVLCWILVGLALVVPFRSFRDIAPESGRFVTTLTEDVYRELGERDWLFNYEFHPEHLMIRAHSDKRTLQLLSDTPKPNRLSGLRLMKHAAIDPSFSAHRYRLMNAADLSTARFVSEWLTNDTNAYQRIALCDTPSLWRHNGYAAVPTGIFMTGVPLQAPLDIDSAFKTFRDAIHRFDPVVFPESPDALHVFTQIRQQLRHHLARMANELGVLCADSGRGDEAMRLFAETARLMPDNLAAILNQLRLLIDGAGEAAIVQDTEARLRDICLRIDTDRSVEIIQKEDGTLLDPALLDFVRKHFWDQNQMLAIAAGEGSSSAEALANKKQTLKRFIRHHLAQFNLAAADHRLNILLDLDDQDSFALLNKARVALMLFDLPEAGVWMDLAKENGVAPGDLTWHEITVLILTGKLDAAREMAEQALGDTPQDIDLWDALADIAIRQKNHNELETRIYPAVRAIANSQDHYLLHLIRGHLALHDGPGEYRAARTAFLAALQRNPTLLDVQEDILRLDDALNIPAFSEADAKSILLKNPEHAFANYLLGSVRLYHDQTHLAEDLFRRSLGKAFSAPASAGLGAALLRKGELENAERFLRQSLAADATRPFTRHTLAQLLMATDRLDEAAEALKSVLENTAEDDYEPRLLYVELLIKQGKLQEARQHIASFIKKAYLLSAPIKKRVDALAEQAAEPDRKRSSLL